MNDTYIMILLMIGFSLFIVFAMVEAGKDIPNRRLVWLYIILFFMFGFTAITYAALTAPESVYCECCGQIIK